MGVALQRETSDVAAGIRRMIRSLGKRVGLEDPDDLRHILALHETITEAVEAAIAGLRANGFTNAEIARSLGITHQAVAKRWPGQGARGHYQQR